MRLRFGERKTGSDERTGIGIKFEQKIRIYIEFIGTDLKKSV